MTDSVEVDYQYQCACGQAGVWQPTSSAARWLGRKHVARRGEGHSMDVYRRVRINGKELLALT